MKKLVLIDGSSFLFRAYHAVPVLNNAQGLPTNAIFGVVSMLRGLIQTHQTDYFTVVFDAKGRNFRHELYPDYKANRDAMPEDLQPQLEPLFALIRAMGLPVIIESGVEADDVLGVLAHIGVQANCQVVIATGDKDMAQLVTEQVSLENTMSNTYLDVQGVIDKFGVKPTQIIDYLALMGDKSDNIPGVPKVGAKTAAKWLDKYDSVENIIACADEFKGKVGESLRENIAQLRLSQQLTTIKLDLDLPYQLDDLRRVQIDENELQQQLITLGFNSWSNNLALDLQASYTKAEKKEPDLTLPLEIQTLPVKASGKYELILSWSQFEQWLERLEHATYFAFDTETTSLDYSCAEIVGVSFAIKQGEAAYVPLAHDYVGMVEQLNREAVLQRLKPLLENTQKTKIGQNLKYDANVLANYDIDLQGIAHDTMLLSYVLNSTATKHNMDDLALLYLNHQTIHYDEVAGKGAKQIGFAEVALEQACPYAAEDADITLRLYEVLWEKLLAIPRLVSLYQRLELPIIQVLSRIECNGVLIDSQLLAEQSLVLANDIMSIEQQAHDMAGQSFNIASPKQIQAILFDKLGLPVLKKTPKGQASTAEPVLQELAESYPLPSLILKHRSLSKLKSTYTDKLPQQVNDKTGRIHTSYHQAVTATGRLSSSNPNLQNIPIRTEQGRKIRQAFIAPEGYKIIAADYSQIELRIMAHLSGDKGLLAAFANDIDIHKATAAEVFGVELEQVTTELRRSAKTINFGLIYGMSAFGLAKKLGIEQKEAKQYMDLYFSRYPDVLRYMHETCDVAKQQGYVETLLGRRLYLKDIHSKNALKRQAAERTAINAPMQGTAADIIKQAMIDTDAWLMQAPTTTKMIMQVHDELVFEVAEKNVVEESVIIQSLMSDAVSLDVALIVDVGVGFNWDEAH